MQTLGQMLKYMLLQWEQFEDDEKTEATLEDFAEGWAKSLKALEKAQNEGGASLMHDST